MIKGWSNFVRQCSGSSASSLIKDLSANGSIAIEDNKFYGERVLIIKESTIKKMEIDHKHRIGDFLDRHLKIVEMLLKIK